jgi:hypothetical protein
VSCFVATLILAGIVAKGFGVIAIIFALGMIVGMILMFTITRRFRR